MYEAIQEQLKACVDYVAEQGHLKPGAAVVLGCSTSEVVTSERTACPSWETRWRKP